MDEWESVRQKIRELESSALNPSMEFETAVDNISVADYWKRRYEDEKVKWEEKLIFKEREKSKVQEHFLQNEQNIHDMNYKIKELEQRLEMERMVMTERSKVKLLEAELDRKKTEWESKLRSLESEVDHLKTKVRMGAETTEEEIRRRRQIEEEKIRLELEFETLQSQTQTVKPEDHKKIKELEIEKELLLKQMQGLQAARQEGSVKKDEIDKELAQLTREKDLQLAAMEIREKEMLESFEDCSKGFAHKVRNYLGVISGTLQLTLANYKMEEELKSQIILVDQNAQEMLKAIEEFLALTKIPDMILQSVSVNEILNQTIAGCEEMARSKNVKIEKKFTESLSQIVADQKILSDAFRHIIENAIEACPNEGRLTVSTGQESQNHRLTIQFQDTGQGVSENHLKKIFQPYFTTKKGKKGLGLSIAKRGVALHKGSISFSSVKNQGTAVQLFLPIQIPKKS